jgi:hypothetical protein
VVGALALPGGIPAHAAPAAVDCPTSATLLAGLRADPLTDEAAGSPAVLQSVSCALPWATAVVPAEGEFDAAFVLFRYEDVARRWKPLNVGSGGVCDDVVPAETAAKLDGCQLNDDSGDDLPDEEPAEDPEEPADSGDARMSALALSTVGGPITRDEIMQRAQGWVDNQPGPYSQRAFSWDPTHSRRYRRDCSGLVGMAWHLNADPWTGTLHQFSDPINKSDLRPGDILNIATTHVVLFKSWKADGRHFTYYTFGSTPVKIRVAAIDSGRIDSHRVGNYVARRYKKIATPPSPAPRPGRSSVSGDARADLLVHGHDGRIGLRTGTGNGFQDKGQITGGWGQWVTGDGDNLGRLHFADINGDGKKDLIENGKNGEINARRGTGTSFGTPEQLSKGWGLWVTGKGNNLGVLHFADVTGDGKADLIENGRNGEINVRRGTGTSFGTPQTVSRGWGLWVSGDGDDLGVLHFADINGDRKADLIQNGKNGEIRVRRGTGTSFGGSDLLSDGWGLWVTGKGNNLGVLHFADINGDGKADLIENGKNGQINVRRGTGTWFGTPDQLSTGWGRWVNGDDLGRLYFA